MTTTQTTRPARPSRLAAVSAAALTLAAVAGLFWAWGAGVLSGSAMTAEQAGARAAELQRQAVRTEHAAFTAGRPPAQVQMVSLNRGETIQAALRRGGASAADAQAAAAVIDPVFGARRVRPALELALYFHPAPGAARLNGVAFKSNPGAAVTAARLSAGGWRAREVETPLTFEITRIAGVVEDTLYASAIKLGATDREIDQLSDVFAFDVDFQRDVEPGDAFEIVFERFHDDNGQTVRTGNMLFVSMQTRQGPKSFYRFKAPGDTQLDWYDANGRTARKALMKTPISGARLSSGFGLRRHPILGFTRMHQGVDFAAPPGTPVLAAGDGVVRQASYSGGYGLTIRLAHAGEHETLYGHLSGVARGVRNGVQVRQGQVIGYVGSSGMSTGPHLHYEVKVKGVTINPMTLRMATGRNLTGAALSQFHVARAQIDALRAARSGQAPDASIAALPQTAPASP